MSLWDGLLRLLGWNDEAEEPQKPSRQRHRPSPKAPTAGYGVAAGTVLSGRVEYVGDSFAKLASGSTRAVVFLREMANHFVSHPSEVLSEGQAVDFVVIERGDRNPDEWVASIAAVDEARTRAALAKLNEGDVISGSVTEIKDRGVVVDCAGVRAWVPISEVAWSWLEHPSDALRLGQSVDAKVLRIDEPDGWLRDSRARRAGAVASVRACTDRPESPEVEMAMSGLPFKVWAVPRKPRSCDPVVSYVLEELARDVGRHTVRANTGLPDATLAQILEALERDDLARNDTLTNRGRRLAEAIQCARELNSDPIRGLFASAAHPASQFLRAAAVDEGKEYPRSWPRPPFNRRAEDTFTRATDEALPELLIERIAGDDKRGLLASLQGDERLRVFLRRDGSRPWKAVWVPVPEHWVLAGLWSAFHAVGSRPYRPVDLNERCRDFLMVRLHGTPSRSKQLPEKHQRWLDMYGTEYRRDQDFNLSPEILKHLERARKAYRDLEQSQEEEQDELSIFFEPATATYWRPRERANLHVRDRKGRSFPDFPGLELVAEGLGEGGVDWTPESWCVVGV